MGRTVRWLLAAGSIVFALALSVMPGAAAPSALDDASARSSSRSAPPAVFAERATARDGHAAASWQNAIELIVLAGTCAIAVAFYSAATARRSDTPVPVRVRRR
jgi:hypothetical protein